MRLLVVASDPMEFKGILKHATPAKPANLPVDWSRTARLNGNEVLLIANGIGWSRAASAVDAAQSFAPEALISTGFCGALDPTLNIADIIVATTLVTPCGAGASACPPALPKNVSADSAKPSGAGVSACQPAMLAPVYSSDRIAQTAPEKHALFKQTQAVAVEMEAQGVAQKAQALRLPFYCIKSVTDLANETMVNDFNAALRPDGHFDTMLIIRRSLRHPASRLPELIRLRNRSVRAANALGEFFANCQF